MESAHPAPTRNVATLIEASQQFKSKEVMRPTSEIYSSFEQAFDYYNRHLFSNKLPRCVFTLQKKGQSFGFYVQLNYERQDGIECDEIALNPTYFRNQTLTYILANLVHNMVHLAQYHFGTAGRGRYHNREWAEWMKKIGLYPSDSGKPGGAETGDRMSHYVITDGAFEIITKTLIASGFAIPWGETPPPITCSTQSTDTHNASKSGKRVKYTCPICGLNAWAKHDALISCIQDNSKMHADNGREAK